MKNREVVIIIPARYASTRLPGKLLKEINGHPLLYYTLKNAQESEFANRVIIATDSQDIERAMKSYGAEVIITSPEHKSGSDRVYEAMQRLDAEIIVNLQGDEPLLKGNLIDRAISPVYNGYADVASLMCVATEAEYIDPAAVKVVVDNEGFALYFSRAPIPYIRNNREELKIYKHIGIYCYTREALEKFHSLPESELEFVEGLEQLRLLQNGFRIKMTEVDYHGRGVDTLEDFIEVKRLIENG